MFLIKNLLKCYLESILSLNIYASNPLSDKPISEKSVFRLCKF